MIDDWRGGGSGRSQRVGGSRRGARVESRELSLAGLSGRTGEPDLTWPDPPTPSSSITTCNSIAWTRQHQHQHRLQDGPCLRSRQLNRQHTKAIPTKLGRHSCSSRCSAAVIGVRVRVRVRAGRASSLVMRKAKALVAWAESGGKSSAIVTDQQLVAHHSSH